MEDYEHNNKGFGLAFLSIVTIMFILPAIALLSTGDTWDRFLNKYGGAVNTECWENSKHERVCRENNSCKFGRLFCIDEVYRWRSD
jgi:hypothetical protein